MEKNNTLEDLQADFKLRSERSIDKAALLKREIECYEYIFSDAHLSMWPLISSVKVTSSDSFSNKFSEYSRLFSDVEVYEMKKAYDQYIVQGAAISEAGEWYKNLLESRGVIGQRSSNVSEIGTTLFNKVKMYFNYLSWLKSINPIKRKYAEKYYAWYHRIKIAISNDEYLALGAKKAIIECGKKKYGTGAGFYQGYIMFNPERPTTFVKSLSPKDRKKWKKIIIEISDNDPDVKGYLKNFPD